MPDTQDTPYLVIARKWRPRLFDEVVGQTHVTTTLKNAIASRRIAHAYLFSGPRGVGKTTVARIFARAVNCKDGPTATPCNNCKSCKEIIGGSSADVLEIDGASNTGVDNVRELRENVRYVPGSGRYRIYIIDEVHMLSNAAFNALLKTIEEPPRHAIFIFATTEVHKVPQTILSRCQRFDFKRIPFKELEERLKLITEKENIKIDEKGIYLIAREADGSLRDAESFLDQVIAFAGDDIKESQVVTALGLINSSLLYELLETVLMRDGRRSLNIVENIYNFGYDLRKLCIDILEQIRNLIVIKVIEGGGEIIDLPDSDIMRLNRLSSETDTPRLQLFFDVMARCYEDISRTSVPRFVMEMALLKAAHIDDIQPLSSIIEGLESLTKGSLNAEDLLLKEREKETSDVRSSDSEDLVRFIRDNSRPISSCIEGAKIDIDGNRVDFRVNDNIYNYLVDNKKRLKDICSRYFDCDVMVKIIKIGNQRHKSSVGERDTVIKEAIQIFGGRIIENNRRGDG